MITHKVIFSFFYYVYHFCKSHTRLLMEETIISKYSLTQKLISIYENYYGKSSEVSVNENYRLKVRCLIKNYLTRLASLSLSTWNIENKESTYNTVEIKKTPFPLDCEKGVSL